MEPSAPEQNSQDPFEQLVQHYQNQADEVVRINGMDFGRFTEGYERLVEIGDEKMRTIDTTGYNIIKTASDMSLANNNKLIFYGIYSALT